MALLSSIANDTATGGTTSTTTTALRQGSTGDAVKQLQTALANAGYYTGAIDGSYGPKTLAAVTAYQQKMGLTVDGIAGPQTQGSLFSGSTATAQAGTAQPTGQFTGSVAGTGMPATNQFAGAVATGGAGAVPPPPLEPIVKPKAVEAGRITDTGTGQTAPLRDAYLPQAPGTTIPPAPVDQKTAGLGESAEQAKQKTLDAQEQAAQENIQKTVQATTGTGGGTGTGTGTGTGAKEPTYSSPNETITAIEGATTGTGSWQDYFKKATETEFQYNPAEDQEYRMAASMIEQQVTDMMVGRGGLYSSVANSALSSRLMSLQVEYQKMAYERYIEDRNFNMQMASFLADREDTEWEKSFKMAQFQADQEQRKFDNQIKTAQLRISQANAAASRAAAQAKAQQAEAQNQLAMMQAEYQAGYAEFLQKVEKWRKQGGTDYDLASYFNVPLNVDVTSQYGNRIEQGIWNWNQKAQEIANYAKSIGDAEAYLNALTGFQAQSVQSVDPVANVYAQVQDAVNSGVSYKEIISAIEEDNLAYKQAMGMTEYVKLMNSLKAKVK